MNFIEALQGANLKRRTYQVTSPEDAQSAAIKIARTLPRHLDKEEMIADLASYTSTLSNNPDIYGYMMQVPQKINRMYRESVAVTVFTDFAQLIDPEGQDQDKARRYTETMDKANSILRNARSRGLQFRTWYRNVGYAEVSPNNMLRMTKDMQHELRYGMLRDPHNRTKTGGIVLFNHDNGVIPQPSVAHI